MVQIRHISYPLYQGESEWVEFIEQKDRKSVEDYLNKEAERYSKSIMTTGWNWIQTCFSLELSFFGEKTDFYEIIEQ